MATQSIVGDKSLAFAKRIARCYRYLADKKHETVMSKQLLRSGTSVGANVREGLYAQSKKDFISKMNIALKELVESRMWLRIIILGKYLPKDRLDPLLVELDELVKIFHSSVSTARRNIVDTKTTGI